MPGGARHAVPAPRRDARAFGGVCEPSHAYHTPSGTVYSRILHSFFFILNSQIPISPLDFRHPSLRYSFIPARRGAPTGGACWRSGERRLRVRPTQPNLRGSRETPPGPTTWVRPATGWWKRTNAGESPRNQGRTVWAPLSVSRRRSRGLRKSRSGAPRGAPVRVMDRQSRPLTGWVLPQGRPTAAADSAAANFGAPLPSDGGAKGSKPTIWQDSPPGCAARQRSHSA